MDVSQQSLLQAGKRVNEAGFMKVDFLQGDIFNLPFPAGLFDHVFICFVLEYLPAPQKAIEQALRYLKPGGSLTVIEGDHGSAYFHPDSEHARKAINSLVELQARSGGDSLIGRRLYPMLQTAGLCDVRVSPRMVYADGSKPELREGFTKKTFTAMVEGVREPAIAQGLVDEATFHAGVRDLYRTAEPDGTFCYTFFKAVGYTPR